MMGAVGAFLFVLVVGMVFAKVFHFWNVAWWQCRKFGNCPYWWPERLR